MKKCVTCLVDKPLTQFYARSDRPSTRADCKQCGRARRKRHYGINKERIAEAMKAYRDKHRDQAIAYARSYYQANKPKFNEQARIWRKDNLHIEKAANKAWREAHRERVNATSARRRSKQLMAMPRWANSFFIEEAYHLAALRTKLTGIKWHVDHIVPLVSSVVCGLHVESNLQVIPASLNQSKSNRHWPDMP